MQVGFVRYRLQHIAEGIVTEAAELACWVEPAGQFRMQHRKCRALAGQRDFGRGVCGRHQNKRSAYGMATAYSVRCIGVAALVCQPFGRPDADLEDSGEAKGCGRPNHDVLRRCSQGWPRPRGTTMQHRIGSLGSGLGRSRHLMSISLAPHKEVSSVGALLRCQKSDDPMPQQFRIGRDITMEASTTKPVFEVRTHTHTHRRTAIHGRHQ